MKRKAAETKKEIQTHKKRRMTSYCENYKRRLVDELRQSFTQDLQTQQQLFGPLLKTTIFLYNDEPVMKCIPYFGREKIQKFYEVLDLAQQNSPHYRPIAMVQTTCSAKVDLCIAAGLDPTTNYYTIVIDLCSNYDLGSPLAWLRNNIKRYKGLNKQKRLVDENDRQIFINWIVILFQIWVIGHVEWVFEIADEFKSNEANAKKACIAALYKESARSCVIEIFDDRWTEYAKLESIAECEKYLQSYLKEVQRKVGELRVPLIVFDHVASQIGDAWRECALDGHVLYDEVIVQVVRRLSEISRWQVCILDHNREVFNIFAEVNIIPFSELPKMTFSDMKTVLNTLFDLNLEFPTVQADLKKRLKKLCGRPFYFTQLLTDLLVYLKIHKYEYPEQFLTEILSETTKRFERERFDKKVMLDHPCGFGKYDASKFFAQVYITTVIQGQDHIVIDDDNLLTILVKDGLVMSNSTHGKQIIRTKDEPMVFEALKIHVNNARSHYKDIICNEIISQEQPMIKNMMNMKGRVTEQLLIWHLIRDSSSNLMELFMDLFPSSFNYAVEMLRSSTVSLKRTRVSSGPSDLIMMLQKNDNSTLLLNHNYGIDACFFMKCSEHCSADAIGVAVISFKPFKTGSFADAIQKVNPDYVLSQEEHEKLPLKNLSKPYMECEMDQEEESNYGEFEVDLELQKSLRINKEHWYRIIYSTEPFPEDVVDQVNWFNEKNPKSTITLLEINDAWLSKEVQAYLRANEPCPVFFGQKDLFL